MSITLIPVKSTEFVENIKKALHNPVDLEIEIPAGSSVIVAYLKTLVDNAAVLNNILKPLGESSFNSEKSTRWDHVLTIIREKGRLERNEIQDVLQDLVTGKTVVHLNGNKTVYTYETSEKPNLKQLKDPQIERNVKGSRMTFSENLDESIALVRWGIKDPELCIDGLEIGRKTKTKVGVLYLNAMVNPQIVSEVHRRLNSFEIDGILDSGYIGQLISDNRWSLFPLTQSTERPDKVIAGILEGRVAIIVEGSPQAILVPVTINELYQSPEDYYFGFWFGSFLRFFRIMGNNLAVALPGLYIALIGVNQALLPTKFVLTVAGSRIAVATPLIIELLIMEMIVEIFREASLRLPTTVSQTLGVTAGIVLGTAAVGAGLASNATLVVVVLTAIASYSGPNYSIGLSWRVLKYLLIFTASLLGVYGLIIAGLVILAHAAKQSSFGVPYLSPWSPLNLRGLLDTIFRRPLWIPDRLGIYREQENIR
ncbi:MAG TPA: spore germination protein, partial [Bacillota bacterium]|nr:spore germination protein [Bacillota bacterium]